MTHPNRDDILEIEVRARALRAAYARMLMTSLFARLRRKEIEAAHA